MRLKVLSVANCPLDRNLGSGAMIVEYATRLRARGHDVSLLGPETYEWLPRLRAGKRLRMLIGYSRATLQAVRRTKFDVVELWGAEAWWVMDRLARRARRPFLVARSNGLEPHFEQRVAAFGLIAPATRSGRAFDRWQHCDRAFRSADLLTVVSEFDRQFAVARRYQSEERLLVIENPLPDDWLGQPFEVERPPVVAFLGSGTPNKGAELLLAALGPALEANPPWRAQFVGVPDLRSSVPIAASVAARIDFRPFVSDRDALRAIYRGSAIVAVPSAYESFGLVAAEAMACGCLLVASDTGFAASLRPGTEVIRVTERSVLAWTRALMEAMADERRAREIARQGHARVQSLRWDVAIRRLVAAYERGLAQRS